MALQKRKTSILSWITKSVFFLLFLLKRDEFSVFAFVLKGIISSICFSLVVIEASWLIFCHNVLRAVKCRLGLIHKETHWECLLYHQSLLCGIKSRCFYINIVLNFSKHVRNEWWLEWKISKRLGGTKDSHHLQRFPIAYRITTEATTPKSKSLKSETDSLFWPLCPLCPGTKFDPHFILSVDSWINIYFSLSPFSYYCPLP